MKLSDEVIAHIAKQLQMAILTGTDVVDNLRLITLHESEGKLYLDPEYAVHAAENQNKMLETANILSGKQDEENE
jgi:hypothetical protein